MNLIWFKVLSDHGRQYAQYVSHRHLLHFQCYLELRVFKVAESSVFQESAPPHCPGVPELCIHWGSLFYVDWWWTWPFLTFRQPHASVFGHFSFHGFLNLGNSKKCQKPSKTRKHQNLETYVPFCGNLVAGSKPSPDLYLTKCCDFSRNFSFQVSRNQKNWQNQQKPETILPFCWCAKQPHQSKTV